MPFWKLFGALLNLLAAPTNYMMDKSVPSVDHKLYKNGETLLGPLFLASETAPSENRDWMAQIPDDTPLFRLSVPGSHDSAAFDFRGQEAEVEKPGGERGVLIAITQEQARFYNCQSAAIFQQLDSGIRALDLRYGLKDGKLRIWHAKALLDKEAEVLDIIWGLCAWLKQHPTETIFVSLKVDNEEQGHATSPAVQEATANVLTATKVYWVKDHSPDTTLGQARGKLVLLRRFPFTPTLSTPSPFGEYALGYDVSGDWRKNNACFQMPLTGTSVAWIEDFYLLTHMTKDAEKQIETKWGLTEMHLNKGGRAKIPNDLFITFSSAVGEYHINKEEDVTPKVMALGRGDIQGVNQRLVEWCKRHINMPVGVGIVFMDFVNIKWAGSQQSNDPEEVPQSDEQVAGPTQDSSQEVLQSNDPEVEEDRDLISGFIKTNSRVTCLEGPTKH